jgi:hypothetical protein
MILNLKLERTIVNAGNCDRFMERNYDCDRSTVGSCDGMRSLFCGKLIMQWFQRKTAIARTLKLRSQL